MKTKVYRRGKMNRYRLRKGYVVIVDYKDPDGKVGRYAWSNNRKPFSRSKAYVFWNDGKYLKSTGYTTSAQTPRISFNNAHGVAKRLRDNFDGVIDAKVYRIRTKDCPIKIETKVWYSPRIKKANTLNHKTEFECIFKEDFEKNKMFS
jgi:hypothetical protein